MERWDISLHNVGTRTGLRVNGSSINKNININNKYTYNQMLQVNQMKQLVLLLVQLAAINTGVSNGQIYRSKQRDKMKFSKFTMYLRRLSK